MNRLADETSPYLLQHADNPVDWYPWGEEALARARAEDRPILLSIGYSACHWCHVMEHESFEDDGTAALMNELFVNVKVDREERPDLDSVYMDAVVALTGHGGWPMTVFLTPEGEPFFGGTYFPPEPRHGLPSFRQVLSAVAEAYRERRAEVARSARELVEAVRRSSELQPSREPLQPSLLADAVRGLRAQFDPRLGRLRPRAEVPARLRARVPPPAGRARHGAQRRSTRWRRAACTTWSAAASTATRSTSSGSSPTSRRCSTTTRCSPPCTCMRGLVTGEERYREVAERTLEYVLRELAPAGGRLRLGAGRGHGRRRGTDVHLDAGGARGVLPGAELLQPFEHGRFVLRGELTDAERRRLFEAREQRPKPARDDKAIASWNGLALAALAEAGRRLDRDDFVDAAARLARVPARAALGRRAPPPLLPCRPRQGQRLSRGLRRRRERPVRAARRDGRHPLAGGAQGAWRCSQSSSSPTTSAAASS